MEAQMLGYAALVVLVLAAAGLRAWLNRREKKEELKQAAHPAQQQRRRR